MIGGACFEIVPYESCKIIKLQAIIHISNKIALWSLHGGYALMLASLF